VPPTRAHSSSGEGSVPGCEIWAQPTKVDIPHIRASAAKAIFMPYR